MFSQNVKLHRHVNSRADLPESERPVRDLHQHWLQPERSPNLPSIRTRPRDVGVAVQHAGGQFEGAVRRFGHGPVPLLYGRGLLYHRDAAACDLHVTKPPHLPNPQPLLKFAKIANTAGIVSTRQPMRAEPALSSRSGADHSIFMLTTVHYAIQVLQR